MPVNLDEFELVSEPEEIKPEDFELVREPIPKIKLTPYEQADIASMGAGLGKAQTGMEPGTELTSAVATSAVEAVKSLGENIKNLFSPQPDWEKEASTPEAEPEPISETISQRPRDYNTFLTDLAYALSGGKADPETLSRRVTGLKYGLAAFASAHPALYGLTQFAPQARLTPEEVATPIVELWKPDPDHAAQVMRGFFGEEPDPVELAKAMQIARGVEPAVAHTVNFFTSPMGISFLGLGGLPKGLHAMISGLFALEMLSGAPHVIQALETKLSKPEDQRDMETIAGLIAEGASLTGFAALMGKGAVKPWVKPGGKQLLEFDKERAEELERAAERKALALSSPKAARWFADKGPEGTTIYEIEPGREVVWPETPKAELPPALTPGQQQVLKAKLDAGEPLTELDMSLLARHHTRRKAIREQVQNLDPTHELLQDPEFRQIWEKEKLKKTFKDEQGRLPEDARGATDEELTALFDIGFARKLAGDKEGAVQIQRLLYNALSEDNPGTLRNHLWITDEKTGKLRRMTREEADELAKANNRRNRLLGVMINAVERAAAHPEPEAVRLATVFRERGEVGAPIKPPGMFEMPAEETVYERQRALREADAATKARRREVKARRDLWRQQRELEEIFRRMRPEAEERRVADILRRLGGVQEEEARKQLQALAATPEGRTQLVRIFSVLEQAWRTAERPRRRILSVPGEGEPIPEPPPPPPAPKELLTWDDFVNDLRENLTPDMTWADVQRRYPQVFMFEGVPVNKEGAKKLLRAARGEEPPPRGTPRNNPPPEGPLPFEMGLPERLVTVWAPMREAGQPGRWFASQEEAARHSPMQLQVRIPESLFRLLSRDAERRGTPGEFELPPEFDQRAELAQRHIQEMSRPEFESDAQRLQQLEQQLLRLLQENKHGTPEFAEVTRNIEAIMANYLGGRPRQLTASEQLKRDTIRQEIQAGLTPDRVLLTISPEQVLREGGRELRIPGWVQVDIIRDGQNITSGNVRTFRGMGFELPSENVLLSRLPQGQIRLDRALEILNQPKEVFPGFTVDTPDRTASVRGHWEIVDLSEMVRSDRPGYDQTLQPREMGGNVMEERALRVATRFDPESAGESRISSQGSIIIDEKNQILSGNARHRALEMLYDANSESIKAYKEWMVRTAQELGFSPRQIARIETMQRPALVRRVTDFGDLSKQAFAQKSNVSDVAGMRESDNAKADAILLMQNIGLLHFWNPDTTGNIFASTNREFLNRFWALIGKPNELKGPGGWNQPLMERRVKNAILALAMDVSIKENAALAREIVENPDAFGRRFVTGILRSATRLIDLRGTDFDLARPLADAIRNMLSMAERGESLQEFLDQADMFADKSERALVMAELMRFFDKAKNIGDIVRLFEEYHREAKKALEESAHGSLFEERKKPEVAKLLRRLIDDYEKSREPRETQGDIFKPGEPGKAGKPPGSPEPTGRPEPTPAPAPTGGGTGTPTPAKETGKPEDKLGGGTPLGQFGKDKASGALEWLKKKKENGIPQPPKPTAPEEPLAARPAAKTPPPIPKEAAKPESEAELIESAPLRKGVRRTAEEWREIDELESALAESRASEEGISATEEVMFPGEPPDALYNQEVLNNLTTVGGNLVANGTVDYPTWYNTMRDLVGEEYRHYFRRAYNQVRDVPGMEDIAKKMTPRDEVELYNDDGVKVGKGAKHRPGLVVRDEDVMPAGDPWWAKQITPERWVGPTGASLDWTQCKAVVMALTARDAGKPAVMIADGPGVGKSGIGAAIAHLMTFEKPERVSAHMQGVWDASHVGAKGRWLFGIEKENLSALQIEELTNLTWEKLTPEQQNKVAKAYGFKDEQIAMDNVHAGKPPSKKVLVVGTSSEHIVTSFLPDFKKFGIPTDNIEFITYNLLSNPGAKGTKMREKFDRIVNQDWAAVIFDEAHALKNAGSNREFSSRMLKSEFKVFMTATPMDKVSSAVYFLSEITKPKDVPLELHRRRVLDRLGLRPVTKVIDGEAREFIVQKEGVYYLDVARNVLALRREAIANGTMIRREFPWWGEVVGSRVRVPLSDDMRSRWDAADAPTRAEWVIGELWEKMGPEERAALMKSRDGTARGIPHYKFRPDEIENISKAEWETLPDEVKKQIYGNAYGDLNYDAALKVIRPEQLYRRAGYSDKVIAEGFINRKTNQGIYYLDDLNAQELIEQDLIERFSSSWTRPQNLKRWNESIKARQALNIILEELEAGRNVVVFANSVNDFVLKQVEEKSGRPMRFRGALRFLAEEMEKRKIPYAQIFGTQKDIKRQGINEFYNNNVRVALVTPQSGGAGLNLDDVVGRHPRSLIVVDISWAGDLFEQVMYRVSRRNTASESRAFILMVRNSLADADIRRKMNRKLSILRGIQAGKDTDIDQFIDDLSNPEDARAKGEMENAPGEPGKRLENAPPKLHWVKLNNGMDRRSGYTWRAQVTDEFRAWYNANGQEKNPFGIKVVKVGFWKTEWAVSEREPTWEKAEGEGKAEVAESRSRTAEEVEADRYSKMSLYDINREIEQAEELIDLRVDVEKNLERLAALKAQRDRIAEMDERIANRLDANPEYQDLLARLEEFPNSDLAEGWRDRMWEIEAEERAAVNEVPGEINEVSASAPGLVPSRVVPRGMKGNPKKMYEIMRDLQRGLGLPIRLGRVGRRTGGYYNPTAVLIRIREVADSGAYFHEAGHAIDYQFNLHREPTLESELMHLGDPGRPGSRSSMRPGKSLEYQRREGVAEFIRYWIEDPETARANWPRMNEFFEALIDANEEHLGFLRDVQSDVQAHKMATNPIRQKVVTGNPWRPKLTVANAVEAVLDDLHMLKLASDDAFQAMGGEPNALLPRHDAYLLFRLLRGNYGRADAWIRYGTVDGQTGTVRLGESFMDAVAPVKTRIREFADYLIALEANLMEMRGKQSGFNPADLHAVIQKYRDDPDFAEALRRVNKWNDALLQYAVDAGYFTRGDVARMKRAYPIYVPLRRLYEVGVNEPLVAGGGLGRQLGVEGKPSALKRRAGSDRPVMDPIEGFLENAYMITFAVEKHRALLALARYAELPGMGKWIVKVPPPMERVKFKLKDIRDKLEREGLDTSELPDDLLLDFWRHSTRQTLPDNIIRVRREDGWHYYQLNPDLYRATMAMDNYSLGALMKVLAFPSQLLRSGITLDPAFALWRNILRDTVSAGVLSRYTVLPFEASFRGMWALLGPNILKMAGKVLGRDFSHQGEALRQLVAEWKASGGANAIETAYFDRDKLAEIVRREIAENWSPARKGLYIVTHPLEALRWLTQMGEESTRIGEFAISRKKAAKLYGGMGPLDAALQAAYEARDLQDFSMQGSAPVMKSLKLLTAFWNAGLQGRYRFFRSLYDPRDPAAWMKTLTKGFIFITLVKLTEQRINWDNEDYWSQPRWRRLLFFHFPLGKANTGKTRFLLVPVPFEAGLIFASIPGAFCDFLKERNVDAATAFGELFVSQNIDNPVPQPVMSVLELLPEMGYDYFRGKTIVPRGLENEPYWARMTESSSILARRVGRVLNVSPAKVEHYIRRSTGGIGTLATHQVIDRVLARVTGDRPSAIKVTPWRTIVTPPRGVQSQIMDDFYEKLSILNREERARMRHGVSNPSISLEMLELMRHAERQLASMRKMMRSAKTDEERAAIALQMEQLVKPFVRTPQGRYRGYRVNATPTN